MSEVKKSVVSFIAFLAFLIAAAACYIILTDYYNELKDSWKTVYAIGSLAAAVLAALFGFRFALKTKSGGKMLAVSGLFFGAVLAMLWVVLQHPEAGSTHISTSISLVTFFGMLAGVLASFVMGIKMIGGKKN
ncbi:MAG: hypothetical protein K6B39_02205 [Lachnospiraceae bacterium]|nr:hypothetical protein [Lachnospiraceae bacterium]